ncbi:MAG: protein phosphatase 2C domain-containing protein [Hyphomicrobiaceae bacterium]|jgi:hypothetical protein
MNPELVTQCRLATEQWRGWLISSVSQQGKRHHQRSLPTDDALLVAAAGDHLLLGVADGVSSCPLSRIGSEHALAAIYAHVDQALLKSGGEPSPDILAHAMANAHYALQSLADQTGAPIDDYSTTVATVLIGPTTIYAANIGDSSLAYLTKPRSAANPDTAVLLPLCSAPQQDDGVTPITFPNWNKFLALARHPVDGVDAVLLATDGAEDFLFNGRHATGQVLSPAAVSAYLSNCNDLSPRLLPLFLADYIQKLDNGTDDRSLIIASPHPALAL